MRIIRLKRGNLKEVAEITKKYLEKDCLTVIPTATVYILAVNAKSSSAVKKIFSFKGRKFGKGISVFVRNTDDIKNYAICSDKQLRIIKTLLPGPFTIVLKSKGKVALEIEAEDRTIGFCVTDYYQFINHLMGVVSFPVTCTSANISNKGPHYSVTSLLGTLSQSKKEMIDLIVDAGKLPRVPTTTVVRLVEEEIEILRKGLFNPKLLGKFKAPKPNDTRRIAQRIYRMYFKKALKTNPVMAILKGELGAGKTVFAQGIGELFGQCFVSPTFALMVEYLLKEPPLRSIYHLDLYRIENKEDLSGLHLERFLERGNLLLIEWGEKLATFQELKKKGGKFFLVEIEELENEERKIKLFQL